MPPEGSRSSPEVNASLAKIPDMVTGVLSRLEEELAMGKKKKPGNWVEKWGSFPAEPSGNGKGQNGLMGEENETPSDGVVASWKVLRNFLHRFPQALLTSARFGEVCNLAASE